MGLRWQAAMLRVQIDIFSKGFRHFFNYRSNTMEPHRSIAVLRN